MKGGHEAIDVDVQFNNFAQVYQSIEDLWKETEEGWTRLATPLEQVIQVHNTTEKGLFKRDQQLTQREDIMDGGVAVNCMKIQELNTKVLVFCTCICQVLNTSSDRSSPWRLSC